MNLGPVSERQLASVGIERPSELAAVGSVDAYLRLKHAYPGEITLVALYALEGALRDVHWNRLPDELKRRLRRAALAR